MKVLLIMAAVMLSPQEENLSLSRFWAKDQNWEKAAEYALKALEDADKSGDASLKAEALTQLSTIDIMTWRDAQAWDYACEAEALARQEKNDTLLADALINKGKLCAYGNIDGSNPRDEEGLGYFAEALGHSGESMSRQVDIHYNISQLYVNMNRFNTPIDPEIYRKAGEALSRGDSIAVAAGIADYEAKALPYRMRYLRQGGRTEEAISACLQTIENADEDNYLMRSQAYDHLVSLWASAGDVPRSVEAHQQCMNATQHYMRQRSDSMLQEMESRYRANLLQQRVSAYRGTIIILVILLAILIAGIIMFIVMNRRLNARKKELSEANDTKEQLLKLISREFTSPASPREIKRIAGKMTEMDEDGIRNYCNELFADNPSAARELSDYFISILRGRREVAKEFGLTDREMEIVRCCRDGLSNTQIAEKLYLSVNTVKNHKQRIFAKMNVKSTPEMLSLADKTGFI